MLFDPLYWALALPPLLLAFYAQMKVRSTYGKYSKIANAHGLSGADVARRLLDSAGLHDVAIERVPGELTDHYDPTSRTVRLSDSNFASYSVASLGVTAHEVGHAIQHATAFSAMQLRHSLVRVAGIGSMFGPWLFLIGLFINIFELSLLGVVLFGAAALFAVVTLPVEFNASNRAMALLSERGLVSDQDAGMAKKVLDAAALTYVAGAAQALSLLLYYGLHLAGMRRSDD
ncbi:MAG: zinc metallopeptidase [Chloroflexota bacterium]